MHQLTRDDYQCAFGLLSAFEAASGDVDSFASAAVRLIGGFVPADGVRLSVGLPPPDDGGAAAPARALSLPLRGQGAGQVSLVLHRQGLDFSEQERARLELLRPHLAFLYWLACGAGHGAGAETRAGMARLTQREREVVAWLAAGKTDAQIADVLAISPRTVQKHLEHVYVKLGVETRTAAVMRALDGGGVARPAARGHTASR